MAISSKYMLIVDLGQEFPNSAKANSIHLYTDKVAISSRYADCGFRHRRFLTWPIANSIPLHEHLDSDRYKIVHMA